MTEEQIQLNNYTYWQRQFIRSKQENCSVCKCYGIENCDEHEKIFRNFNNQQIWSGHHI